MTTNDEKNLSILRNVKPWDNNSHNIWLASTIKLIRNVEQFSFPSKLSIDQRQQLVSIISKSLLTSKELNKPILLAAKNLAPHDKEFLFEHYLSTQSFHQARNGDAFIIDHSGSFLAILNIRDHLQLQLTEIDGNLENSWNKLVNIETMLGSNINFAFSPQFGFLTADPSHCGTGLQIHIFLQLSALVHTQTLNSAIRKHCPESISATGMQGDPDNFIGDIVVLTNEYTLGISEESIVSSLRSALTKLMVEEKSARTKINEESNPTIKDQVSRAFGLLRHSYQIETIEAINAISLVKLGLEMGWITGTTFTDLNELFFHCRRAHLLESDGSVERKTILHKRAEAIHSSLKDAKITT